MRRKVIYDAQRIRRVEITWEREHYTFHRSRDETVYDLVDRIEEGSPYRAWVELESDRPLKIVIESRTLERPKTHRLSGRRSPTSRQLE